MRKGIKYQGITAFLSGVSLAALLASCGDTPLRPEGHRWEEVAIIPSEETTKAVESLNGPVWCADANYPAVYRISNGVVEVVFKGAYPEAGFYDIASADGYVWAVGYKKIVSYYEPYAVKFDGQKWEEISFPKSFGETYLNSISGVNFDFWWVVGERGVYTYDRGVWEKRLHAGLLSDYYVTVSPHGRTFAYCEVGGSSPGAVIYISDNGGVSWSSERPKINNKNFTGGELPGAALCTWGERLCAAVILNPASSAKVPERATYYGVLIRDEAPPGDGSYELAFFAPEGPYVSYVRALAFRPEGRGYLVGKETSIRYEDGVWVLEVLAPWRPEFFHVTAGFSGFWATAYLPNQHSVGLYKAY